jgi:hypothetical protein
LIGPASFTIRALAGESRGRLLRPCWSLGFPIRASFRLRLAVAAHRDPNPSLPSQRILIGSQLHAGGHWARAFFQERNLALIPPGDPPADDRTEQSTGDNARGAEHDESDQRARQRRENNDGRRAVLGWNRRVRARVRRLASYSRRVRRHDRRAHDKHSTARVC